MSLTFDLPIWRPDTPLTLPRPWLLLGKSLKESSRLEAVCRERDLRLADIEARHTNDISEALAAAG
jgi:hypothetical protein